MTNNIDTAPAGLLTGKAAFATGVPESPGD
jgi:hypothetical protein